MNFKNRRLKATTAIVVLVAFGWTTSGGNVWAETRSIERDPASVILRLADNPQLALSREEKEYMRQAAARLKSGPPPEPVRVLASYSADDPAGEMKEMARELGRLARRAGGTEAVEKGGGDAAATARVRARLETTHKRVLRQFADTESLLRSAKLPKVIFERHEAARTAYANKMQEVLRGLDAAGKSQSPTAARSALEAAAKLLAKSTDERPSQQLDPSRLPFRAAEPTERQPFVPKQTPGTRGKAVPLTEKLVAPTAADLAPTEDAQITQEIRDLAASLDNQPLKIYNWVRNNIEFVPTYGSVQGSQMTLDAKRGNAFDISSLLIAMLRAAGVSAKYVTGTVDVPASTVMSWVGGAETPRVAQQILGQGGVPTVGLIDSTGAITRIRIDHVWVEAFIDYIPSRGAIHVTGDTWVPMDAAFKLHNFTPASPLFADNPIGGVLQPGDHLFDVDESLGQITNVNGELLDQRVSDWVVQADDYSMRHPVDQTLDGLLGGQTIIQETRTTFAASLPYSVLTRAAGVSVIPENRRHYVTLNGFDSTFDRALGDPSVSVKLSLPTLNSRRLSIQFEPATQADADTLAAARTSGASSLPAYLVHVIPVIKVDGIEQGRGNSIQMGGFYPVDVVLQGPEGSTTIAYQVVAGDEIVAGITGNGVTRSVVAKRFAQHPVDNPSEYLHQVGLHYWAESDYLSEMAARPLGVHALRLPSVGFFSSPLTASYLFGAPRSAVYESRIMDVKQSLLGAAGADPAKVVAFMKQAGMYGSYLEGSVFDQLEGRPAPASRGISSMHLIQAAADAGVPIYRITPANAAAAMPRLQLSSAVRNDIQNAVNQGKTVLAPERDIDIGPWSGAGYIIQDETTGAGAYMISGGASGGGLLDCIKELVPRWVQVLVLVLLLALLIALIIWLLGGLAAILAGLAGAGAAAAEAFAAFMLAMRGLAGLGLAF